MRGEIRGEGDKQTVCWWKNRKWKKEKRVREQLRGKARNGKRKPCACPPAWRSKSNSWLAADTGAQGVFIGLQDFNPQYWPKPLAEGWQPCLQQTINHSWGGQVLAHSLCVPLETVVSVSACNNDICGIERCIDINCDKHGQSLCWYDISSHCLRKNNPVH